MKLKIIIINIRQIIICLFLGFGRTFRKFVRNWYLKKDFLQLAEIIGDRRKYRGWRHSDFMKLAHVKTKDPGNFAYGM